MNRPFYAIGVLLAFLAIAMLAVGSTSRPRTVACSSTPEHARRDSDVETKLAPTGRGAIYVFCLPEGEIDASESGGRDAYAVGCGLDRQTGTTYPMPVMIEQARESLPEESQIAVEASVAEGLSDVGILPVTICFVAQPSLPVANPAADCLAHYDVEYDRLVYGQPVEAESVGGTGAPESASDAECLELMQQLLYDGSTSMSLEAKTGAKKSNVQHRDTGSTSRRTGSSTPLSSFAALVSIARGTIEQLTGAGFDSAAMWFLRLLSWAMPEVAIELARIAPVSG